MATQSEDRKTAAREVLRHAFEAASDAPQDLYDLLAAIGGPQIAAQKCGNMGVGNVGGNKSRAG